MSSGANVLSGSMLQHLKNIQTYPLKEYVQTILHYKITKANEKLFAFSRKINIKTID